jgi:hypothetical protein
MPEESIGPETFRDNVVRGVFDDISDVRPGPLQSAGGNGTFDGMEARVARLESDIEYIKRDVGEIKTDLRALRDAHNETRTDLRVLAERVSHLPTKGYIFWVIVTGVGFLAGIVTIAPVLQSFFGLVPPS